jgi:hypothetical protein
MMASRHSEWCASQTGVDGTIPLPRRFDLNNLLLAKERLRAQVSCKKQIGKARMSLMLFWGVGFAAFGWLVFKIELSGCEKTGQHGPASKRRVAL